MAERGPHLAPLPSGTFADEDCATLLLVVELEAVVDCGRPAAIRELARRIVEANDDHRPRRPGRDPESRVGVVSRESTREPVGGAVAVDRARFAVVRGEDDSVRPLRGRESLV